MILRPILILVIFFGTLFYFREPLQNVAPSFSQLHSEYADSFKKFFKEVTSASSTTLFGVSQNYIPFFSGSNSTTSGYKTSTVTTIDDPQGDLQGGRGTSSANQGGVLGTVSVTGKNGELLPVISNQNEASLSVQGIILGTNAERQKQGLPYLNVNKKLTESAESKLQDMFKNQYFEHMSPSGDSVSDVVRKTGYDYIVVGENLALGVFSGDSQVVAAWMASPGHRKNILDSRYQEIGIAIGQGTYQGRKQWLIVQHFGKPLSSCPSPSDSLKKSIETQKAEVAALENRIAETRKEIDSATGDAYVEKANEYNTLVIDYNTKLTMLKQSIDSYNTTVRQFNTCAGIAE